MNNKIYTFTGPGLYLEIPVSLKIINPKCEAFDGPSWDKYGNYNSPKCICIHPRIKIPYGYSYKICEQTKNIEILPLNKLIK